MKDKKRIDGNWFCGTDEGTFEKSDGKRFCFGCGKMIRAGDVIIENRYPTPRRMTTTFSYRHKKC